MPVRMEITGVLTEQDGTPILFLREIGGHQRHAAIAMQFPDIRAVYAALHKLRGPRPSAHIGWAQTIRTAGIELEGLIIHGIGGDDAVLCLLRFRHGDRRWTIDCRPSDGIAVALRLDAPILCEEAMLERLAIDDEKRREQARKEDEEAWRRYLEQNGDKLTKQ